MLFLSVTIGLGEYKTYTCDYDLENISEIVLEKQFSSPVLYSRLRDKYLEHSPWMPGFISIFDGTYEKSVGPFESIEGQAVAVPGGDAWYVLRKSDSDLEVLSIDDTGHTVTAVGAVPFDYDYFTVIYGSWDFLLYSYRSSKACIRSKGSMKEVKLPFRPKFRTGMISIPGGDIIYFSENNELIRASLNEAGDEFLPVFNVPVWSEIGGTELTPSGIPVFGLDRNFYVVTQESGKLIKFCPEGNPLKSVSLAGLTYVSEFNRFPQEITLISPEDVQLSDMPVLINRKVYELIFKAGVEGEEYVKITAGKYMALSTDGEVWKDSVTYLNLDPEEEFRLFYVIYSPYENPGGLSVLLVDTPYTDQPLEINIRYTCTRRKSTVLPLKATGSGVPGARTGDITVQSGLTDAAPVKIPVRVNFQ